MYRETLNEFMIKDIKTAHIYTSLFETKFNHYRDISSAKANLVLDSSILSDYHIVGSDLINTA